jgi:nitroimidazol reductase NimA-like FMN-containing flavoprotein (pyridoxamine 5'-phosphate oxidase superfamily)
MFREMRRKEQLLSQEETVAILKKGSSGVLGVSGDDDYPYTVPISYVYQDGKLFFHGAPSGHKIDSIRRNNKVSFCIIDQDEVIQKTFTTHFRSAIVFGRARIVTDDQERRMAIEALVEKYSPDYIHEGQLAMERGWEKVCLVEINIEHMTGKAAKEIIPQKDPSIDPPL